VYARIRAYTSRSRRDGPTPVDHRQGWCASGDQGLFVTGVDDEARCDVTGCRVPLLGLPDWHRDRRVGRPGSSVLR
jgi:hypothetical protein